MVIQDLVQGIQLKIGIEGRIFRIVWNKDNCLKSEIKYTQ